MVVGVSLTRISQGVLFLPVSWCSLLSVCPCSRCPMYSFCCLVLIQQYSSSMSLWFSSLLFLLSCSCKVSLFSQHCLVLLKGGEGSQSSDSVAPGWSSNVCDNFCVLQPKILLSFFLDVCCLVSPLSCLLCVLPGNFCFLGLVLIYYCVSLSSQDCASRNAGILAQL